MKGRGSTYRLFSITGVLVLGLLLSLSSCRIKFNSTGTEGGDPNLKTITIDDFTNQAAIVVPYLAQELTNQMQDRFQRQSRLTLTTGAADIRIGGTIVRYDLQPVAIQGDESAAQNRLTIAISVSFENFVNPKESWTSDKRFSAFVDVSADEDFASQEEELINEVLEQITQDVFSASIGKW
ncbi:MAG: LPS assembly lipoprotein LptE [Bacteroidia bacterium]|nr:LPS assembly lipoprotein LptE [Bacteroidia bacterium]